MQSTHKISGDAAAGFAAYLTAGAARGDYYAGGGDDEVAGVWHGSPAALTALGLDAGRAVGRDELASLMRGVSPADGSVIRRVGADGSRVAGIDLTFSAPKSVSALWAVGDRYRRAQIEAAHRAAVASARERIEREVAVVRRREDGVLRWEHARSLVAAEFVHTASRLTADHHAASGVPDPQLHSHLVVLAAERTDGRFAAVDSRELFRSARVNGAWYRAELAARLGDLGLEVRGRTGRDGRYFELAGVAVGLSARWSARSEVIDRQAARFRSRYGREPSARELDAVTVRSRGSKTLLGQVDVDNAWRAVAEEYGLSRNQAEGLFADRPRERGGRDVGSELLEVLGRERSMVSRRELDARAYEVAAGVIAPSQAQKVVEALVAAGELIELEGSMFTTRELRDLEQQTLAITAARRDEPAARVSPESLTAARRSALRELRSSLSVQQGEALDTLTGPGGVSVLVGQAGTGKGVVLSAAAAAWRAEGYDVWGTAIAGATAKRLGADAKLEQSASTDALLYRLDTGAVKLGDRSVVMMDEAGMADTRRLARLVQETDRATSKLVLVGDEAQLGAIGAGGLFGAVREQVPSAELTEVRRARHEWERDAWAQIRAGNADQALAAYRAHRRLEVSDSRQDAATAMVDAWDRARQTPTDGRSVMLTDASNRELDEVNALAQQRRVGRNELGNTAVPVEGRPYSLMAGDEVMFSAVAYPPGQERVENGTLGTVSHVDPTDGLWVRTHESHPREVGLSDQQAQQLRLAYAQHVYKAQGATVDRAFVLMGGWETDRERAYVALTRARESTEVFVSRDDLGQDGLDDGAIQRLGERIALSQAEQASVTRTARPQREQSAEIVATSPSVRRGSASGLDSAADARRAPTGEANEAPIARTSHLGEARQPPTRRESEAGRILREAKERERDAAIVRDSDPRDGTLGPRFGAGLNEQPAGVGLEVGADEFGIADPRSAAPEVQSVAERESEAGRLLREQKEREAIDRGWGIE